MYPNIVERRCHPDITGRDLSRARHAVYILYGCFTGDGVVNDATYADGPHGWGLVQRLNRGRRASLGHGATRQHVHWAYDSLFRAIVFSRGRLETITGNTEFFDDGDDTRYPFVERWKWRRGGFDRTFQNAFIAHAGAPTSATRPAIPTGKCPKNGTFAAAFGARLDRNVRYHPDEPLRVLVFAKTRHYPTHPNCVETIRPRTPMKVLAAHTSAHKYFLHRGHISNRRWITAPAWFLVERYFSWLGPRIDFFAGAVSRGYSPYVVPRRLGVNEILSGIGRPETHSRKRNWRTASGQPTFGTVSFRHGRLVALAVCNG